MPNERQHMLLLPGEYVNEEATSHRVMGTLWRIMQNRLGFIGAGNMAEAIARGVIAARIFRPSEIIAADISAERRDVFADQLKVRTIEGAPSIVSQSQTVLFCVKPQHIAEMLSSIRDVVTAEHLIVSIAAGISTSYIEAALGTEKRIRVVRVMPNTPMLVGKGMSAIAAGSNARAEDMKTARRLFESAGSVVEVKEDRMNAVTALSGSGPAYFFFLVEHMIAAGVEMGLSPEAAHEMATQTARGAAEMLCTSTDSPAELRRKVTSPGGTTAAAITHMQEKGMPQVIIDALKAAERRGHELGK